MKTVRVVGLWCIKHLLFVLLAQSQELHSPEFALLLIACKFFLQGYPSGYLLCLQRSLKRKISCQGVRATRGYRAADAMEERISAKDIEIEGIRMLRILVLLAHLEGREIAL